MRIIEKKELYGTTIEYTAEHNNGKKITIIEKQNGWGWVAVERDTVHIAWGDLINGEFCGGIIYMQFGVGTRKYKQQILSMYNDGRGFIKDDIYYKYYNEFGQRKIECETPAWILYGKKKMLKTEIYDK